MVNDRRYRDTSPQHDERLEKRNRLAMRIAAKAFLLFLIAIVIICGFTPVVSSVRADTPNTQRISSVQQVAARIARAHDVILSAYVLSPHGRIATALLTAASHGARVHVILDGVAYGNVASSNMMARDAFRQAGIRVDLTPWPLHAKAAIVDGIVYLTDRNWTSHDRSEIVLEDSDPRDKPLVLRAMLGQSGGNEHFSTRKQDALQLEATMIATEHTASVDLETEAFTPGSTVESAIEERAGEGTHVRLLVDIREFHTSPRERIELSRLAQAGVEVRVGDMSEKLAVAGQSAWVGSANATPWVPDQIDWGMLLPHSLVASAES